MKIEKAILRAKEILETGWYNVLAIFLYGSQNYEMDTENSDIDLKAVVLPSLSDIVRQNNPTSLVYEYEFWQIDVKDIRLFLQNIRKSI